MAPLEKNCGFGHYLHLHRTAKGKSLEEISTLTKIPVSRLRQLETEDISNMPAPVFVKGFVRAYAAAVGADVQDALHRFDACCNLHLPSQPKAVLDETRPFRFWWHLFLALVLLATLITGSLAVTTLILKRSELPRSESSKISTPAIEQSTGLPPDRQAPSIIEMPAQVAARADENPEPRQPQDQNVSGTITDRPKLDVGLSKPETNETADQPSAPMVEMQAKWFLKIVTIEPTWLRVAADDKDPVEMSLKPDEVVNFKASNNFKLLIGNAGGINLVLNENVIGIPGESGQVLHLQLP